MALDDDRIDDPSYRPARHWRVPNPQPVAQSAAAARQTDCEARAYLRATEARPVPRPLPGSKEELDMGRDRRPEPSNTHSGRAGAIGVSFGWHLPARPGAAVAAGQLEAEAG
jgi:hypothetical protein